MRKMARGFRPPSKYLPPDANEPGHTFALTKQEQRVAVRWMRMHMNLRCPHGRPEAYRGAIGGAATYRFTPTSIGTLVSVYCSCGAYLFLNQNL